MQTFTLNIGLRTSLNQFNEETRGAEFALTEQDQKFEALMACALLGGHNCRWEVQESNTERTLVVQFDLHNLIANELGSFMLTVKFLADTLEQDCIAVYNNTTDYGVLVGAIPTNYKSSTKSISYSIKESSMNTARLLN